MSVIQDTRHASRNRLAIILSHYAGFRVGEISHLKVRDVLDENLNCVDNIYLSPAYTKGARGRLVAVSGRLKKEIKKHIVALSEKEKSSKRVYVRSLLEPHMPLIASQKNGHFSPNSLCQLFGELYGLAGITGASSHSGRRYFITKLAHKGVSPKVIMGLVGHQQYSTTIRYVEVNQRMKQEAVNLL